MHGVWNLVMVGGLLHIGTVADSDVWVQYLLDSDSLLLTGGDFGIEATSFLLWFILPLLASV